MAPSPSAINDQNADFGAAEIRANLRRLERRDLWVWGNAALVIFGLTAAVVSLYVSLSFLVKGTQSFFGLDFGLAVRALVGLVVVFTAHMFYQHLHLRKIQRELAEQQIHAEVFRRLAMFDPLTGLYNRRFAEQRLSAEIARSERKGLSLIVVLLDLNDFKQINDTYGHTAGDIVLKEFGKRLSKSTRGSDLAVRWGGDEFMMLLVDCDVEQLPIVLLRLEEFTVEVQGKNLPVSYSVGWKAYQQGDRMADLIEGADQNLYLNKVTVKGRQHPAQASV